MDWYPRDFEAYAQDTRHLTTLEHGAYSLLLDDYYRTRSPLPDNDLALANIAKMHINDWMRIATTIRAFFKCKNGHLHQKKADQELDAQDHRAKRRTAKATKAALIRHGKYNVLDATSTPQASVVSDNSSMISKPIDATSTPQASLNPMLGDATGTGTGTGTKNPKNLSSDRPLYQPNGENGFSNGHHHGTKNGKSIEVDPLRATRAFPGSGRPFTKDEKHAAFEQNMLRFALVHRSTDSYAALVALQLSDDPADQKKRKAAFNEVHAEFLARKEAGTLQPMD